MTNAAAVKTKKSAILDYIRTLPQKKQTLIGVQVNEFEVYMGCNSADRLAALTGKRPAIMGLELMNAIAVPFYAGYVVDRALTQSAVGGLVTLTWHERNPVEVCIRGEFYDCTKKPMTDETFSAMLTKGTPENKLWLADVDAMAKVLQTLRDRGIVVLFRPYHEMSGGWFWWGKKKAFPQLWDALYDELAVRKKLDNLIWVWSSDRDTPDAQRYVPLRHKPDIVGIDVYENDRASPKFALGRANLAAAFGDATPFAVTELGRIPNREVIDEINPAWVLLWGGEYLDSTLVMNEACKDCNTPEMVSEFFNYDRTLTLNELPASLRTVISAGVVNKHPLHLGKPYCPVTLH
jgi:mannan endo-1,4-beta-mannosidase